MPFPLRPGADKGLAVGLADLEFIEPGAVPQTFAGKLVIWPLRLIVPR